MNIPFAETLLTWYVRLQSKRKPIKPIHTLDSRKIDRILLVLTTGLGDAILSTPAFKSIRIAFPKTEIALFIRDRWLPLFKGETDLNTLIPYYGKWRHFFSTTKNLRIFSPQLTIILHCNDPDIIPLCFISGSEYIIRIPTSGTNYSWLLSNKNRLEDRTIIQGLHYIENRLRILNTISLPIVSNTPIIKPRKSAMSKLNRWRKHVLGKQELPYPYVVLHPWAADLYKTWPIDNVEKLISLCHHTESNLNIIITGSSNVREQALQIADKHANVFTTAGHLDLEAMTALLADAIVVVAPDTGILHLAAALNVATIGLYSPTQPKLVGQRAESAATIALAKPITCTPCQEKKCPYNPAICMEQITAESVLESIIATTHS